MPKGKSRGFEGFFHICLISDDIEKLADDILLLAVKGVAIYGIHGRISTII